MSGEIFEIRTVIFPNLWFCVVATAYSHYVEFVVYEVSGFEDGDETKPIFPRKGATHGMDCVDSIDESHPYLHGYVKWDGCSNWHFDEQDRVMIHGCTRDGLERIGNILVQCWDMARKMLKTFDGE